MNMTNNTIELETQLNAVLGFVLWMKSGQTVVSDEFADELVHILQIFGWELNRQIDKHPATADWFSLIAVTTPLVVLLQDELLELNPALKGYKQSDEPTTIHQMIARLLFDALTLFEASQNEMAAYLQQPAVPGVLTEFIQRVLAAQSLL